ncbi:hypothetical protein BOTBODRAFT_183557 [Botryobasidium botryosum FD-172 SS1]|uniref:Aquaporin n=1 Tax=Botryobasidium botryosum (strain FD-172 SS1) TaxID=930990 RepID=A0A067MZ34_BOTB1|nr:hypothetical protein BOTBODRAFT_183557 [Botryobasidium botryosum FD-172 SS1]
MMQASNTRRFNSEKTNVDEGGPNLLHKIWALRATHWAEFLSTFTTTLACIVGGCQAGLLGGDDGFFATVAVVGSIVGFCMGISSGGYGNPVFTLGMAAAGRLSHKKVPSYLAMQFAGAFLAAAAGYEYYSPAVDVYEGGTGVRTVPGSAVFFTSIYVPDILPFGLISFPIINHIIIHSILVLVQSILTNAEPQAVPFLVAILPLYFFIPNVVCRLSMNPARDLAPCLVLHLAGYGSQVWTQGSVFYWPVTLIGVVAAGIMGTGRRVSDSIDLERDLENQSSRDIKTAT